MLKKDGLYVDWEQEQPSQLTHLQWPNVLVPDGKDSVQILHWLCWYCWLFVMESSFYYNVKLGFICNMGCILYFS